MGRWLQANAVTIVAGVAAAWIAYALVRALLAAVRSRRPTAIEEFERTAEIRQQIRRRKAERKANAAAADVVPGAPLRPPSSRGVRPIDPFGGPRRGWWNRVRRWLGR